MFFNLIILLIFFIFYLLSKMVNFSGEDKVLPLNNLHQIFPNHEI